jgi:competence protein ComEA
LKHVAAAAALALYSSAFAVELNTATQAELEQLKGIGVELSERLIAEREARPFRDWADVIDRLPGIGAKQATRLSAAGLRVEGTEYAPPGSGGKKAPTR